MYAATIVICTRNRAESLRETLAAIGCVEVPSDLPAELIVADNGSTDATRQVVDSAFVPNMPVRYVYEPTPGKGYAYNAALAAARGDVLLFTDDDVRPPLNWIECMCRPIIAGEGDAVAGGVRAAPHLERPWLKGFLRLMVACTECWEGNQRPQRLIGANMAIGRHVFSRIPAFDTELGPGSLGFGDETLLSWQLVESGFRILGRWDVSVEHHFDEKRLSRSAFLEIAERMGRSQGYIAYHWEHRGVIVPRLHLGWYRMKLAIRRALSRGLGKKTDRPIPWECAYVSRIAYHEQFISEHSRSRQYAKRGHIKIGQEQAASSVAASRDSFQYRDTIRGGVPGGR